MVTLTKGLGESAQHWHSIALRF